MGTGTVRSDEGLRIELEVHDPEVVRELAGYEDPVERARYAAMALRIGVMALKQARGQIDAEAVRNEGQRLLDEMRFGLTTHQQQVTDAVATTLGRYFDPSDGQFTRRVESLVRQDGDLERLLRRELSGDDSELARMLVDRVGAESPIMRMLDPSESEGLLATLQSVVEEELREQREKVLVQFSLDDPASALSRLVREVVERNGNLEKALESRIDDVTKEFSLDNEGSALSRLVGRVEQAQKQITREFSLDDEASSLARMRRELVSLLEKHETANRDFQAKVMAELQAMSARKEAEARSTTHGASFEERVYEHCEADARADGDIPARTGNTTGFKRNCKVGDLVVELGPEHAAAGSRIVVEAKEDRGYDLRRALAEAEEAAQNRGAGVSVFVCSAATAGKDIPVFARYGDRIIVTWDAEDPATDVYLDAALSLARALATRDAAASAGRTADFEEIERAVLEVEKQAAALGEITTWAETISSNSGKILERVRITRDSLGRQVMAIRERVRDLGEPQG